MEATISSTSDKPPFKKNLISNRYIKLMQKRHFLMCDVLPLVGFVVAIVVLWNKSLTAIDGIVFLGMCFLTSTGITVGYHRLFTHRSFNAHPLIRNLLVILGSTSAQGPLLSWVANHRHHHGFSDQLEDTHSPHTAGNRWLGLWHSHLSWKWEYDYPNPVFYAPELLRDQAIQKVSRWYYLWIILGLLFPAVVTGILTQTWLGVWHGFWLGGVIRLYVAQQTTWCINSVCHLWGQHPFQTRDRSVNNFWLALPTAGESWHNNHHAFQHSAKFGLYWWQIDLGYWVIRLLQIMGLVWDVTVPTELMIQAKKAANTMTDESVS
ncbi:acyl-CoA desaturase [Trichocoleus sp. FACHB-591]|uniref:acyl-CoA desaturase n=1 Tax=Trichocoleus sp. FACHB-591 TaxID=2692872 RepID=UPI001684B8F6|nr:acyl-CoA desaturase [Trichocoleus sp. FACHB-591]MBD2097357.1 acyl-CoA desaturase [Trichocoleus sp. FACHB-591]